MGLGGQLCDAISLTQQHRRREDFESKMMQGYAEVEAPMGQSRGDVQQVVRMLELEPSQEMS